MTAILLNARQISKHFAGVQALRDVSLTLHQAEIRCLAGENGSGKSTLIKVIAGIYPPDAGEIWLDGERRRRWRPLDAIRAGIQVIYQDFSLFPNLTVAENIALTTQLEGNRRWVHWREVVRIAEQAIELLGVELDHGREVGELSVAEKQLVSIARALVQSARLIIMDEPTTALTRREIERLFELVKRLQQRGVSILFVSHQLREVLEISEQITVLRNGEKVAEGSVEDFDSRQLTRKMTGRHLSETRYTAPKTPTAKQRVLRVALFSLPGHFQKINFSIRPGEIVGWSGLLGSGRTALALALFGLRAAEAGELYINEQRVTSWSVTKAIRHGIAYLPEDRLLEGLFLEQSIERNLAIGRLNQMRQLLGFLDFRQMRKAAACWIDIMKIKTHSAQAAVQSLSGGNQQKIVLARWLDTDAQLLILNRPTVGVDIGSKMNIHAQVKDLAQGGLAVIVISDDLPEILHLCNRILFMHRGRFVDELEAKNATETDLAARLRTFR